jgi:dihydroorotate dehydrogenase (fumarate)
VRYARDIEAAGADALELNIYYLPTEPDVDGARVESMAIDLIKEIHGEVSIPLAVKLSPFYSSIPNLCVRVADAGADGVVLFNRFYQPDLDIEGLDVVPDLHLSNSSELRLRLRWVAVMYGQVDADIAVTGGVHTARDVVKCMMAGSNVAMMTSALLKSGIGHASTVLGNLNEWMEENEYDSIELMQGSMSRRNVADPASFTRANYMKVLNSYSENIPTQSF